VRAAGATKATTVTARGGGINNNQLKAIRGSGRNGGGGGSSDGGKGDINNNSNQDGTGDSDDANPDALRTPPKQFLLRRLLSLSNYLSTLALAAPYTARSCRAIHPSA
jgi:hypothetical protein